MTKGWGGGTAPPAHERPVNSHPKNLHHFPATDTSKTHVPPNSVATHLPMLSALLLPLNVLIRPFRSRAPFSFQSHKPA